MLCGSTNTCRTKTLLFRIPCFGDRQVILALQKTAVIFLSGCLKCLMMSQQTNQSQIQLERERERLSDRHLDADWGLKSPLKVHSNMELNGVYACQQGCTLMWRYTCICACLRFRLCLMLNKLKLPFPVMHREASAAQWQSDGCDGLWD